VNQNAPSLFILPILQPLLNPLSGSLKFPQEILILHVVYLNIEMLIFLPVLKVLEIIFEDRNDMSDTRVFKGCLPT
jgi:hypothetical protein